MAYAAKRIFRLIRKTLLLSYRSALRKPRLIFTAFVLLTMICFVIASQIRTLLLVDDMIDPEFKTYVELTDLNTRFPEKNLAVLVAHPQRGYGPLSKSILCDIREWVQNLDVEKNHLIDVTTSFGVRTIQLQEGSLQPKRLLPIDCGKRADLESTQISGGLKAVRESPWGVVLGSPQADDVTLQFHFRDTVKNRFWLYPDNEKKFDSSAVLDLIRSFETQVESKHSEIKSTWGGVATFQAFYKLAYDQANLLNGFAIIIMLATMWFLFGTIRSGLLYFFSFCAAVAPVFGGMALAGAPVDVLTNSIGLMVLIAALEDYLFVGFYLQKHRRSWKTAFRRFLVPSFFTTMTTVIGFGSLAVADMAIIRRFGIWAAVGSLFQFITVYYFLPAVLQLFPYFQNAFVKPSPQWRWLDHFQNLSLPRWIGRGTSIVFALSLLGVGQIVVSDAPTNIFPADHPTNQASRDLLQIRGWQATLSLVFKKPEANEFNQTVIADLRKQVGVVGIEDTYAIKSYLKRDLPSTYHSSVDQLWSLSGAAKRLRNDTYDEERAIVYVAQQDIESINRLYQWVQRKCGDSCYLAGSLASYGEFGQRVLSTLMESLVMSLVLVSLILIFLCLAKDVSAIYPIVISAIWGPMAMIFYFVTFRIPIFYITSMFASILVGLAGDNSIQFIFSKSRGSPLEGVKNLGHSSTLIMLSMSALSSVMFFSHFVALRTLAFLMICGFFLMLFGDIAILRALEPKLNENNGSEDASLTPIRSGDM